MEEAGQQFYETHERYCGPESLYTSLRLLDLPARAILNAVRAAESAYTRWPEHDE